MLNSLDKLLIQEMEQEEKDEDILDHLDESEEENGFDLTNKLF